MENLGNLTFEEYVALIRLGRKYKELEEQNRVLILPWPLGSVAYRVIPDCEHCGKADAPEYCQERSTECKKKVMPCVFTVEMVNDFGVTVFGTEPEAIVAAVS